MVKILIFLLTCFFLTSCAQQYIVEGNSTVQSLDGRMLYLKAVEHDRMVSLDSCEVVHGKFKFVDSWDSTMMVSLFMDDESIMPLVLENADLSIHIDHAVQSVTGSPLNEELYKFIHEKSRIDNLMSELPHKESQMIMDGMDHDEVLKHLAPEAERLNRSLDSLVMNFISTNFDNVLGSGVFMIMTSGFPYPIITPQIDELMQKATPYFKNNSYVREYMKLAKENMILLKERQKSEIDQPDGRSKQYCAQ